jgi:hypothetical protein
MATISICKIIGKINEMVYLFWYRIKHADLQSRREQSKAGISGGRAVFLKGIHPMECTVITASIQWVVMG